MITHNRGQGDDAAAVGSKKFPGSARGSAEDNDEDVDEKEDDGLGPDNLKVRFQTLPFGCGVNQADAEAHDRHPNSR